MKRKLLFIICGFALISAMIVWAGCTVERPNPCDCAFNETYRDSSHWDEKLSKKCTRYAESLNSTDRNVWESEKQNCLAAAGKP